MGDLSINAGQTRKLEEWAFENDTCYGFRVGSELRVCERVSNAGTERCDCGCQLSFETLALGSVERDRLRDSARSVEGAMENEIVEYFFHGVWVDARGASEFVLMALNCGA